MGLDAYQGQIDLFTRVHDVDAKIKDAMNAFLQVTHKEIIQTDNRKQTIIRVRREYTFYTPEHHCPFPGSRGKLLEARVYENNVQMSMIRLHPQETFDCHMMIAGDLAKKAVQSGDPDMALQCIYDGYKVAKEVWHRIADGILDRQLSMVQDFYDRSRQNAVGYILGDRPIVVFPHTRDI